MLKKNLGPLKMLGFARYEKRTDVATEDLIEAALKWQRDFLNTQNGIAMHCFLGNNKGQFADAIMAVDEASFMAMSENHPTAESSQEFMALLKPETIRLTPNRILKEDVRIPEDFSCIEFGTFSPNTHFTRRTMLDISTKIEEKYLSRFSESKAHFMGQIDDTTYSEIAFVENLGMARRICNGYIQDDTCLELLGMFAPESVDLDFWYKLA
ncbi:hypothetical protein [Kiloniella antarctica]|uniref:EthD domain-containing protein n=1 Tax=Kiloniella antarctica TaxID=1550907 RepID=A0ABW5BJA4_9PROT